VTPQESDRPQLTPADAEPVNAPQGGHGIAARVVNMEAASTAQRDLIANLADRLRLRNVDPWAEDLTKQDARELIGQLNLRRISARLKRPVTVDASDAEAVRRELARLEQLDDAHHTRHARAASKHLAGEGPKPQTLPSRRVQVTPMPQPKLTAKQESDRRVAMDRGPIVPYATGRHSESTGHGGHASYSLQRAESLGEHREQPTLTDPQERLIVNLQDEKGDHTAVAGTVEQAVAEIERLKDAPGPATARQAAYLADLQRRTGVEVVPASNRDAASAEITWLREQLYSRSNNRLAPAEAEPVSARAPGHGIGAGR